MSRGVPRKSRATMSTTATGIATQAAHPPPRLVQRAGALQAGKIGAVVVAGTA